MTTNWETTITIHRLWHKKQHMPSGVTSVPFLFILSKESTTQVSNMNAVIFLFFLEGGNIYSGSTFIIPGSGFDTTSCRNRNCNKLGGYLFERQGTP